MTGSLIAIVAHLLIQLVAILRVLLRPHREPASRIAWIVVIVAIPIVGILAYWWLGEVNIGHRRVARLHRVVNRLPPLASRDPSMQDVNVPERYQHLFELGRSISHFSPVGGNQARLMEDSNATIDSMVADIDRAESHVHLIFYIWLSDHNGCKMVQALKRAAQRGIKCRAMADGLGSRSMIKSAYWKEMKDAGVQVAVALPIANLLLGPLVGRADLRNHRKVLVIDGKVTYCGSQNCADPEFRVKAKYAPWVDTMVRFEGPIAQQNERLFASDWMTYVDEDIDDLLQAPIHEGKGGFPAAVVATGPTVRNSAMPEMFTTLMYAARRELVITSPYYVPDESLQSALCATAYRGVETTIIFPARNDSWIVAAASRSYYADLLAAGVKIHEYVGGLLHAKTLTLDGEVALIGSANLDRRSFDLNYENNILLCDPEQTGAIRQRQQQFLDHANEVTVQEVEAWPVTRRLWNNSVAMLGPIL
ncbi:cardiolipin synthase [Roseiconus nitratireducens]|uniref:Cardiolipin synthase n=1 Tax=Roseiconus nitratireducens TaxID=2605748 RepID=A0A5M6D6B0_9BACT|nr:cardiolipin synthase [Roseiconus nitratireducens]KAA5543058.1 cardiolipin synthase [Roseiconus nitratireducens]